MPEARGRPAAKLLADRIAATLVNHEPGWQLPRPSAIARRHNVGDGEIQAAIDELVSRQLVRRSPDGRVYRASPAEYLIPIAGMAGLGTSIDPMGADLTCLSYQASRKPAHEDAAVALRVGRGEPLCVLELAWALDGTPAAVSTTYLVGRLAETWPRAGWLTDGGQSCELPLRPHPNYPPHAAAVQMQLPPASAARRLRLRPGQMAVLVTVIFADAAGGRPAALTAAMLRPDMFRITVQAAPGGPGGAELDAAWPPAIWDHRR